MNGYGQSAAALGRIMGPIASAPLFAWSETSGSHCTILAKHNLLIFTNYLFVIFVGKKWPLNYHFVFYLLVVGAIGAIVLCFWLPASSEKKRERETTEVVTVVEVVSEQDSSGVINNSEDKMKELS